MTPLQQKGHLAIFSTNILFAINIPLARTLLPLIVSPIMMTQFRYMGAAAAFWILSLFLPAERVAIKDLKKLFLASCFAVILNQSLFLEGLANTSSTDASIMVTFTPLMTMVLAAFFMKEPITWKKAIGVFLGMAGALLLILTGTGGIQQMGSGRTYGNILCLLSGVSYAIYLTAFKDLIVKYTATTLMKWMFLFAAVLFLPFAWGNLIAFPWATTSLLHWSKISYVVFVATFVTYLLIPIAQKNIRPTTMTMYNNLQPLIATAIAIAMGMDFFDFTKVIAAVLIFFGVYAVTKSKSREQIEKEHQKTTPS